MLRLDQKNDAREALQSLHELLCFLLGIVVVNDHRGFVKRVASLHKLSLDGKFLQLTKRCEKQTKLQRSLSQSNELMAVCKGAAAIKYHHATIQPWNKVRLTLETLDTLDRPIQREALAASCSSDSAVDPSHTPEKCKKVVTAQSVATLRQPDEILPTLIAIWQGEHLSFCSYE